MVIFVKCFETYRRCKALCKNQTIRIIFVVVDIIIHAAHSSTQWNVCILVEYYFDVCLVIKQLKTLIKPCTHSYTDCDFKGNTVFVGKKFFMLLQTCLKSIE